MAFQKAEIKQGVIKGVGFVQKDNECVCKYGN